MELGEEKSEGQKKHYDVNDTKLKGLVRDLDGTDRCLILCANSIGACLNLQGNMETGIVLAVTEFCDFL